MIKELSQFTHPKGAIKLKRSVRFKNLKSEPMMKGCLKGHYRSPCTPSEIEKLAVLINQDEELNLLI